MIKMLNLGCGNRYFEDWTNVDFVSKSKCVISHNLLKGIPFAEKSFDVVYHSHVLEHFSRKDGIFFLSECYRVLKDGGLLRIAVPDLEQIAKQYLLQLEGALDGNREAARNYEWIMLELYDQAVRTFTGGEMAQYLAQNYLPNEAYIYSRIGYEAKNLRSRLLENITKDNKPHSASIKKLFKLSTYRNLLLQFLLKDEIKCLQLGKFRASGEIHQWMYDRFSLSLLLNKVGFKHIEVVDAYKSKIPNWHLYQLLDIEDGEVRKPDSIFLEATK